MQEEVPFGDSVTAAQQIIDLVADKSCKLLQEKFKRVMKYAGRQGCNTVDSLVRNVVARAQQAKMLKEDSQPIPIQRDNFSKKVVQLEKRFQTANKTASVGKRRSPRSRMRQEQVSQPRSRSRARQRALSRIDYQPQKPIPLNPQMPPPPTAEELDRTAIQERYRRFRFHQDLYVKDSELNQRLRESQRIIKFNRLLKEKEQYDSQNLKYTWNFDGKLLLCDSINNKKMLLNDQIFAQVKGIPLQQQEKERPVEPIQELKNLAARGEVFRSMLDMTKQRLPTYNPKTTQRFSWGANLTANDEYNNNNMRQISSIPLIQLAEGSKLVEDDCKISSQTGERINLKDFINKVQDKKFISHRKTSSQQNELVSQVRIRSPVNQNPMIFSRRRSTRYKDVKPDDEPSVRLTASTILKSRQKISQPRYTPNNASKINVSNLFNTSQDFFKPARPQFYRPWHKHNEKVQANPNLINLLQ